MNNALRMSTIFLLLAWCGCDRKSIPVQGAEMTVATYNIHFCAAGRDRVRETLRALGADIIALQEDPVRGGMSAGAEFARELGYHHASSAPYAVEGGTPWVLTFLSKHPIAARDEVRLGSGRRALRITIGAGATRPELVTTHLSPFVWDAGNLIAANRARSQRRRGEIDELRKWLGSPAGPRIILGDLNSLPIMGELAPLRDEGYRSVWDALDLPGQGTFRMSKSVHALVRKYLPIEEEIMLDYVLVAGPSTVLQAEVVRSDASDHYPLKTRVRIP